MRIMKKGPIKLKIVEHIITRNYWEFYICQTSDANYPENIKQAFVMGFENELGDVNLNEIKPFILTRTKNLTEVAPAVGFEWED